MASIVVCPEVALRFRSARSDSQATEIPPHKMTPTEAAPEIGKSPRLRSRGDDPFTLGSLRHTSRGKRAVGVTLAYSADREAALFEADRGALEFWSTLLLLLTLATFGMSVWDSRLKREQALVANDIQLLSHRIANLAQQAASGNPEASNRSTRPGDALLPTLRSSTKGGSATGSISRLHREREIPILRGIVEILEPDRRAGQRRSSGNSRTSAAAQERRVHRKERPRGVQADPALVNGAVDRGEDLSRDRLDAAALCGRRSTSNSSTRSPWYPPNNRVPRSPFSFRKTSATSMKTVKGLLDGNPEAGISALQHRVNRDTASELLKTITELKAA